MKKLGILSLIFVTLWSCNNDNLDNDPEEQGCDNGTFVGEVRLESQAEVNEFGAQCYTKIDGLLYLGLPGTISSDIKDLRPLSSLTEVFSTTELTPKIYIIDNDSLPNLNGLHNITKASGIWIAKCDSLRNLNGLEGLTSLYGEGVFNDLIVTQNLNLESLDGLQNVGVIGAVDNDVSTFLSIQGNPNLEDLDALSNLDAIYGNIFIGGGESDDETQGNLVLSNLCGLSSVFEGDTYENVVIEGNAYNPTIQDIINGNCSN